MNLKLRPALLNFEGRSEEDSLEESNDVDAAPLERLPCRFCEDDD
jgi:hypothetical protein